MFHSVSYHVSNITSSFLFIFCCLHKYILVINPRWFACVINRMTNNSVSDEGLKLCKKWTMPKLLYTKQSASLQIVAVFWVARSCSLDVNDRKQVLVMQNGLMWLQWALLLCDSKLFWTTGIQTRIDFETNVLTFFVLRYGNSEDGSSVRRTKLTGNSYILQSLCWSWQQCRSG